MAFDLNDEPLKLEALAATSGGEGLFRLIEPFSFDYHGEVITVPAGYVTDLASIPAVARPFFSISGKVARPAVLHDWLIARDDPRAPDVFNEALRLAGVDPTRRRIMVAAVRLWQYLKYDGIPAAASTSDPSS